MKAPDQSTKEMATLSMEQIHFGGILGGVLAQDMGQGCGCGHQLGCPVAVLVHPAYVDTSMGGTWIFCFSARVDFPMSSHTLCEGRKCTRKCSKINYTVVILTD